MTVGGAIRLRVAEGQLVAVERRDWRGSGISHTGGGERRSSGRVRTLDRRAVGRAATASLRSHRKLYGRHRRVGSRICSHLPMARLERGREGGREWGSGLCKKQHRPQTVSNGNWPTRQAARASWEAITEASYSPNTYFNKSRDGNSASKASILVLRVSHWLRASKDRSHHAAADKQSAAPPSQRLQRKPACGIQIA